MDTPMTAEQRSEILGQLAHDLCDVFGDYGDKYSLSTIECYGVLEYTKYLLMRSGEDDDADSP